MPTQAEANLSALIETTEDSVWSVDLDYRLLTFNKAFQLRCVRNFGVRPKVGMSPWDFPPEGRGEIWPPLYDRAFTEGPFRIEYTTFDKRPASPSLARIFPSVSLPKSRASFWPESWKRPSMRSSRFRLAASS